MTTNFTLRDFFVYLLTGLIFSLSFGFIFHDEIFNISLKIFDKYDFITEFSFLLTIFLLPLIYLVGHLIGSLSYNLLKFYVWIHPKLKSSYDKNPKWRRYLLHFLQKLLYRQRVVYQIIKIYSPNQGKDSLRKVEEFWTLCASIQIHKAYTPAEYWYVLNELFNSINIIFFISMTTALIRGQWILSIVFFILTIFAFNRAKQYSDHFVKTVIRLSSAKLYY